jgi:hypothetical protein
VIRVVEVFIWQLPSDEPKVASVVRVCACAPAANTTKDRRGRIGCFASFSYIYGQFGPASISGALLALRVTVYRGGVKGCPRGPKESEFSHAFACCSPWCIPLAFPHGVGTHSTRRLNPQYILLEFNCAFPLTSPSRGCKIGGGSSPLTLAGCGGSQFFRDRDYDGE